MLPTPFSTYPDIRLHFSILYIESSRSPKTLTSDITSPIPKQFDNMPIINAVVEQVTRHIREIEPKVVREIDPRV